MIESLQIRAVQFALFANVALAAWGTPLLSIQPPRSSVAPGDSFSVTVNATEIADLYAFQFDFTFVPGILAADAVSQGAFFEQDGTTIFVPGSIDNSTGTIQMTTGTRVGAIAGVSGSGPLVGISLRALGAGMSPLTLSRVILLDSNLEEIDAETIGAASTVVPEPAACTLFAAGLAFLGTLNCIRRRSKENAPRQFD